MRKRALSLKVWVPVLALFLFSQAILAQFPDAPDEARAREVFDSSAERFGLTRDDVSDYLLTDHHVSRVSNVSHFYFQQRFKCEGDVVICDGSVRVYNAIVNVGLQPNGDAVAMTSNFVAGLGDKIAQVQVVLTAQEAAVAAVRELLGEYSGDNLTLVNDRDPHEIRLADGSVSDNPILAQLRYYPDENGQLFATWMVMIGVIDTSDLMEVGIDAADGSVRVINNLTVFDTFHASSERERTRSRAEAPSAGPSEAGFVGTNSDPPSWTPRFSSHVAPTYRVFPLPVQSPSHAGDPSVDNRVLLTDPSHPVASPRGWHDDGGETHTTTIGNNVWGSGIFLTGPSANGEPVDGGDQLLFDFPLDLTGPPREHREASTVNLFYLANSLHDIFYLYGFDEAAGNLQHTNFSGLGLGGDRMNVAAQGAFRLNNASMLTYPEGVSGSRMEMFLWDFADPMRDSALNADTVAHEYAHAVTVRLTGGASTNKCLTNREQPGEGWSDWYALMLTGEPWGDRGRATYLLGDDPSGPGLRPARYSTNPAVNAYTYGDLGSLRVPHGTGFVWATALYEMSTALIEQYGFDPDPYEGSGGNNKALTIVTEALKMQPCSPGFVDARDAILAADQAIYGGSHQCLIWNAFAKRGLGMSADQGSSDAVGDEMEAFDVPAGCAVVVELASDPHPAIEQQILTYTVTASNATAASQSDVELSVKISEFGIYVDDSASDGGQLFGDLIIWPAFDMAAGETAVRTFQVFVDSGGGSSLLFRDDMESGPGNWAVHTDVGPAEWTLVSDVSNSPNHSWFAENLPEPTDFSLIMAEPMQLPSGVSLRFWTRFLLEADFPEGIDGGVVELSLDEGLTWIDARRHFKQNGYNLIIGADVSSPLAGRRAYSGRPSDFVNNPELFGEVIVDLTELAGEEVLVRFRLVTDDEGAEVGWHIDDVSFPREVSITAEACSDSPTLDRYCRFLQSPVYGLPEIFTVEEPTLMWPPDRSYHTVDVSDIVTGVDDPLLELTAEDVVITRVVSDEPEFTAGGQRFGMDIVISDDCRSVSLRSERDVQGNGRVYTIHLAAQNSAGLTGAAAHQAHVPRDIGSSPVAILGPGPGYEVFSACAALEPQP